MSKKLSFDDIRHGNEANAIYESAGRGDAAEWEQNKAGASVVGESTESIGPPPLDQNDPQQVSGHTSVPPAPESDPNWPPFTCEGCGMIAVDRWLPNGWEEFGESKLTRSPLRKRRIAAWCEKCKISTREATSPPVSKKGQRWSYERLPDRGTVIPCHGEEDCWMHAEGPNLLHYHEAAEPSPPAPAAPPSTKFDIEAISAKVHEQWVQSKLAKGVTTRKSETGEELMIPYASLSEAAKDLDRGSVKAVLNAIEALND